jgi:Na+/H+ antiporter NhaD/arsenite permease-like protein
LIPTNSTLIFVIFILTYFGVAIGGIPGLKIDRTGIALLGAIAVVVTGGLTTEQAVFAVDVPTILLLYALMVVSAQFRLGGFYTFVALKISALVNQPTKFLALMMLVSAVLSAMLANDIVCLAFTPVLTVALLRAKHNPTPFLIGLAAASNIGSAATIIGNPQNMLIGQLGKLEFGDFLLWCALPSLLALMAAFILIHLLSRSDTDPRRGKDFRATVAGQFSESVRWPEFNRHQSAKGVALTAILMILFFTDIPRELSAIAVAGVLLCSRYMHTRAILGLVDWHLLTLFCGLFVVLKGIEVTNLPALAIARLSDSGIDLSNLYLLTLVSTVLSNLVSNVPAVMLLIKFLNPADPVQWYVLALSSTFAGNLITIGSIANLITFEGAKEFGVNISFKEHARLGAPITLASLVVLVVWIWLVG